MAIFLYNPYMSAWIQQGPLANTIFALDPSNSLVYVMAIWCFTSLLTLKLPITPIVVCFVICLWF